jgi:hypothetical protein
MTFRITKTTRQQIIDNRQPGVTLLLAILLLSAFLAISFSLSTILLFQVRTSEDFAKTEGALYAANGVGEQALFNTERQVPEAVYTSSFDNNSKLNGEPVLTSTTTPIFQDQVEFGSTFATTANKYDFCGAAATSAGCGYSKIVLTYLPTGNTDPLIIYLCQFDPEINYGEAPCTSTGVNSVSNYWITNTNSDAGSSYADDPFDPNGAAMPSTAGPITWTVDPDLQQQLILYDPVDHGSPIYVSISTFGADGSPMGLPIVGKTSVSIDATNGTTGRKIQVVVPNP